MTRQRRLGRGLVLATTCALLAATATGSALAWSGTGATAAEAPAPAAAPAAPARILTADAAPSAVTHSASVVPRIAVPVAAAKVTSSTRRVSTAGHARPKAATHALRATSVVRQAATPVHSTARATTSPVQTQAAKAVTAPAVVRISSYLDAPGSQAAIDACHLVLWAHRPLWLAGHNWCGFQWMAFVRTGTVVVVAHGAAAGTYVVTGHLRLAHQGGAMPQVSADLVLQTCVGSGTGLTLLRRT